MTRPRMHDDELDVDVDLVRELVAAQFPHWAGMPIRRIAGDATVNAIFRIGEGLSARLPLREHAIADVDGWLHAEADALEEFAGVSPFPAPRHVAFGRPGGAYPLPWAVQTWLPGAVATPTGLAGSRAFADDLVTLIAALRAAPTRGRRFAGAGRGGDPHRHAEWVELCLSSAERAGERDLDVAALRDRWRVFRALPHGAADVMSHGDLHPANLLVDGEHLVGVLDAGGFAAADPALDLVAAWHLLDAPARDRLRAGLGSDDLEWTRGAAWAFVQAIGLVWYYRETNPGMSALGRSTLARILADPVVAALPAPSGRAHGGRA